MFIAIYPPERAFEKISPSVKTTALNLLGGMDSATSGNIFIDGNDITEFTERRLVKYRREDIGFVFQFYNLVQNLTALENVELATEICRNSLNPKKVLTKPL